MLSNSLAYDYFALISSSKPLTSLANLAIYCIFGRLLELGFECYSSLDLKLSSLRVKESLSALRDFKLLSRGN